MTTVIIRSAMMTTVMERFTDWLNENMTKRNWSQYDLATRSGLSQAAISKVLSGERKPGIELCKRIAKAFDLSTSTVLQIAGLLPKKEENTDPLIDQIMTLSNQLLNDEDKELLIQLANHLVDRQGRANEPNTFKPRTSTYSVSPQQKKLKTS